MSRFVGNIIFQSKNKSINVFSLSCNLSVKTACRLIFWVIRKKEQTSLSLFVCLAWLETRPVNQNLGWFFCIESTENTENGERKRKRKKTWNDSNYSRQRAAELLITDQRTLQLLLCWDLPNQPEVCLPKATVGKRSPGRWCHDGSNTNLCWVRTTWVWHAVQPTNSLRALH